MIERAVAVRSPPIAHNDDGGGSSVPASLVHQNGPGPEVVSEPEHEIEPELCEEKAADESSGGEG